MILRFCFCPGTKAALQAAGDSLTERSVRQFLPRRESPCRELMKKIVLAMIRFYRRAISPWTRPCCRFTPTCSTYALEAVEKYGAWKGSWLAVRRILRCNPLFPGGYDPVP